MTRPIRERYVTSHWRNSFESRHSSLSPRLFLPYAISYWWSFGTKPLSLTVSEIFTAKCNVMVDVTSIRPINKGQGHSFWCQSISHTYTTSYRLWIVTLALGRTVRPQYITSQTDRRQTQHCSKSGQLKTVLFLGRSVWMSFINTYHTYMLYKRK